MPTVVHCGHRHSPLVVRRQIAVPRERVFEVWLDSESLADWMRPGNFTHATVTVDPRVGADSEL
jgi:uncharacterized protein YndB with AHSA1/START domain